MYSFSHAGQVFEVIGPSVIDLVKRNLAKKLALFGLYPLLSQTWCVGKDAVKEAVESPWDVVQDPVATAESQGSVSIGHSVV